MTPRRGGGSGRGARSGAAAGGGPARERQRAGGPLGSGSGRGARSGAAAGDQRDGRYSVGGPHPSGSPQGPTAGSASGSPCCCWGGHICGSEAAAGGHTARAGERRGGGASAAGRTTAGSAGVAGVARGAGDAPSQRPRGQAGGVAGVPCRPERSAPRRVRGGARRLQEAPEHRGWCVGAAWAGAVTGPPPATSRRSPGALDGPARVYLPRRGYRRHQHGGPGPRRHQVAGVELGPVQAPHVLAHREEGVRRLQETDGRRPVVHRYNPRRL